MRIAIVAPLVTPIREPQLGGSQALLADLAQGLSSSGHDVTVFAARGSAIDGVDVAGTGVDAEELADTLYRADGRGRGASSDAADKAFARVWADVAGGGFDVAHNHAFDAPAIARAPAGGPPVVHTLHLPPDEAVADAVAAAQAGGTGPTVCCVSETQARGWRRLVRVDAVLRNGVPVARIRPSEAPGSGAVFAGRFSSEKGAAEAIDIAVRAGLDLDMFGSAYDAGYAADNVEPWDGRRGVRVHAPVARSDLWARMAAAAVVLCPAMWDEPFGLVAAEAQACGTPVVGFRRGGLVEIVWEGVTGALVPGHDVVDASEEAAKAQAYDRRAIRRHAESTLDLRATVNAHEQLYERLSEERVGGAK